MSAGTWGLLELMGHRSHLGLVSEVTMAGVHVLRVQVPHPEKKTATGPDGVEVEVFSEIHHYSMSAFYGMHERTEESVRADLARFSTPYIPQLLSRETDDDPSVWPGDEGGPDGD